MDKAVENPEAYDYFELVSIHRKCHTYPRFFFRLCSRERKSSAKMKRIFAACGKKSTFLSAAGHRRFAKGKNEKVAGGRLRARQVFRPLRRAAKGFAPLDGRPPFEKAERNDTGRYHFITLKRENL